MNYWENAMDLDTYLISEYPGCKAITNQLFEEICKTLQIRNSARSKATLQTVVINLWLAYMEGRPVMYSRSRQDYQHHRRYGKLYIRYKRLIPIIDELERLEYVVQKIGFYDRIKQLGRRTRMAPALKLIRLFQEHLRHEIRIAQKTPPEEIVQLKDADKILIDYPETRSVKDMRRRLRRYNEFISDQTVEVVVRGDAEINLRFLRNLKMQILKGVVDVQEVDFMDGFEVVDENNPVVDRLADILQCNDESEVDELHNQITDIIVISSINPVMYADIYNKVHNIQYHIPVLHTHSNLSLIIYTSSMTRPLNNSISKKEYNYRMLEKRQSADFGISKLVLKMNYLYLHRVFSNDSFKQGGRFYGAYHLELPKTLRQHILLNGEPIVELDFSALHIRMLYHMEGIDYREDPYRAICDRPEERKIYKLVQLIAINAENEKNGIMAIRDQLRKNGFWEELTNQGIREHLSRFQEGHPAIAKYLNAGIGLTLQNLDGKITDRVLTVMTREGIPCLPVHDSYIVPRPHRDLLEEVMSQAYEEVMGFLPVIK